jgi:hypothetical protein
VAIVEAESELVKLSVRSDKVLSVLSSFAGHY